MSEKEINDQTITCVWCGEKRIPIKQKSNARGYGFYGCCPKCKKETVVKEIDTTNLY